MSNSETLKLADEYTFRIYKDGTINWFDVRDIVEEAILAERKRSERTIRELEYQIKMQECVDKVTGIEMQSIPEDQLVSRMNRLERRMQERKE